MSCIYPVTYIISIYLCNIPFREHNVETIIMLTEIIEQGKEQCYPYWPEYNIIDSLKSENILIVARDKLVREDYQVSKFILKHKGVSYRMKK